MEIQVLLPKANGKVEQPEYKPANKTSSTVYLHFSVTLADTISLYPQLMLPEGLRLPWFTS